MKTTIHQLFISLALAFGLRGQILPPVHPSPANFGVVNIIPNKQSAETDQNSEPSLAVGDNRKLVVHTFSYNPDAADYSANLYYTSIDGGVHWQTNGTFNDWDSTLDWSPGGTAYVGIITPLEELNLLRSSDPTASVNNFSTIVPAKTVVSSGVPLLRVVTVTNTDHIYVGVNSGDAASVYFSLDGGVTWKSTQVETADPGPDGNFEAVRLAISGDGKTVYALFQRIASKTSDQDFNGGIVLVRDDSFGGGLFNGLPGNGTWVTNNIVLPSQTPLGQVQRIYVSYDVAIHPTQPNEVYVAYTEVVNHLPVLRVQRSSNSGASFNLIYSNTNAALPALAITEDGTVGLLFARKNGSNLEIHFLKAYNGDFTIPTGPVIYDPLHPPSSDRVLATFPDDGPSNRDDLYLGDYFTLKAINYSFFGVFCALGDPDPAHFPSGVYYQRNVNVNGTTKHDFYLSSRGTLSDVASNGVYVAASIDPFFFYDFTPLTLVPPGPPFNPPLKVHYDDPRSRLYRFAWPVLSIPYPQFLLESTPELGPFADWSPVTNGDLVETNGAFELTLDLTEDQQFFRLSRDVASGQFQIFTSAGSGGSLDPMGTNDGILLETGAGSEVFTATPDSDYSVGNWYVDGELVQSGNSTLTLSNISVDHTVLATFVASHDLAVTMGARRLEREQPFLVGTDFNFVINVHNTGLETVSRVTMTDLLPDTVSFVSATTSQGTVDNVAGVVEADLGTLDPGASAAVTITVVPNFEGMLSNTVNVVCTEFEPDLDNNTATQVTAVLAPVTITNQPASQVVLAGDPVSFSVDVSGTPPFFYQWAFNGMPILGATDATLNLVNVTVDNAGSYTVTVFQRPGLDVEYKVESDPATLDVIP